MSDQDNRYFEELAVGEEFDCGSIDVEKAEMLEFAERYDPQPFHVDEEAAAESMYGDLIASGWLTCALTARLLVTGYMNRNATLGGNGMNDVRWHRPVYAGDTLSVRVELVEKRSGDNPTFGHTRVKITTTNQNDDTVLTMYGLGLVEKRDAA
ncbi:MaoC family dehydratase [Natrinema sp. 1APR25-10V2]|uniref:MaoC family dehydratase n=1 Tax=Natrinema sp. 1APR25-10V2 TaxID=2951081 RepID=UPI002874CA93|nr:MaoC family dehydratase [Natrinema sp. 1APR25-10V2]MDS0476426.1 MaoC family dehydratase [Natrinema sp. 1APR25-10V2]